MPRSGANFSALSRVEDQLAKTADVVRSGRKVTDIARDAALDALRVLHDALTNPNDKYRIRAAEVLISTHCKLEQATADSTPAASVLSPEERRARLVQALQDPDGDLAAALRESGYARTPQLEPHE